MLLKAGFKVVFTTFNLRIATYLNGGCQSRNSNTLIVIVHLQKLLAEVRKHLVLIQTMIVSDLIHLGYDTLMLDIDIIWKRDILNGYLNNKYINIVIIIPLKMTWLLYLGFDISYRCHL